jgi:hypothetical protein
MFISVPGRFNNMNELEEKLKEAESIRLEIYESLDDINSLLEAYSNFRSSENGATFNAYLYSDNNSNSKYRYPNITNESFKYKLPDNTQNTDVSNLNDFSEEKKLFCFPPATCNNQVKNFKFLNQSVILKRLKENQ